MQFIHISKRVIFVDNTGGDDYGSLQMLAKRIGLACDAVLIILTKRFPLQVSEFLAVNGMTFHREGKIYNDADLHITTRGVDGNPSKSLDLRSIATFFPQIGDRTWRIEQNNATVLKDGAYRNHPPYETRKEALRLAKIIARALGTGTLDAVWRMMRSLSDPPRLELRA
jgi:hypothetical protein